VPLNSSNYVLEVQQNNPAFVQQHSLGPEASASAIVLDAINASAAGHRSDNTQYFD
jgi:hypothetical protein